MLAGVEIPAEDSEDEAVEDMEEEDMAAAGPMAGMGERIMGMA